MTPARQRIEDAFGDAMVVDQREVDEAFKEFEAEARQSALAEAIRRVEEAWTTHGAITRCDAHRTYDYCDTGATTGGEGA